MEGLGRGGLARVGWKWPECTWFECLAGVSAVSEASIKVVRYLEIVRFSSWYYILIGILLYCYVDLAFTGDAWTWSKVIVFASLYLTSLFTVNNFYDVDEDNPAKNFFKAGLSRRAQKSIVVTSASVLLLFAWQIDLILSCALMLAINFLYSAPPVRLKRYLYPSLLINGVLFAYIYCASVALLVPQAKWWDYPTAFFVFSFFVSVQFVHWLEHLEVDRVAPKNPALKFLLFSSLMLPAAYFMPPQKSGFSIVAVNFYLFAIATLLKSKKSFAQIRIEVRYLAAACGIAILLIKLFGANVV